MAELSQYQKRKQVTDALKTFDRGQKALLLEELLEEWSETLPKRGKDYGVTGGGGKYLKRLEWLQDHWGTAFTNQKGTHAVRRMPLGGVLELLVLFALGSVESKDEVMSFGSMENGSELGDKVASGLTALRDASGEQVVISRTAFNELQRIRREYEELGGAGPEASTKVIQKIFDQLLSMPSVKTEKETKAYEVRKGRKKKEEMPDGLTK